MSPFPQEQQIGKRRLKQVGDGMPCNKRAHRIAPKANARMQMQKLRQAHGMNTQDCNAVVEKESQAIEGGGEN